MVLVCSFPFPKHGGLLTHFCGLKEFSDECVIFWAVDVKHDTFIENTPHKMNASAAIAITRYLVGIFTLKVDNFHENNRISTELLKFTLIC